MTMIAAMPDRRPVIVYVENNTRFASMPENTATRLLEPIANMLKPSRVRLSSSVHTAAARAKTSRMSGAPQTTPLPRAMNSAG